MTSTGAHGAPVLDVIPLGGLGEFGMNMMLVACGDTAVLIDAGVMFPEPELFGVDLVIPDLDVLDPYKGKIRALVLTHGHEDHIGAIAHVIDRVDGSATPDLDSFDKAMKAARLTDGIRFRVHRGEAVISVEVQAR